MLHLQHINSLSHAPGTRSFLVLFQFNQQLSEPLLPGPSSTAFTALAAEVDQLGNSLPASSTSACVLPVGHEFFCFLARLSDLLVLLGVVVFVEVIDGCLGSFDRLFLFLSRGFGAMLKGEVAAFAPFSAEERLAEVEGKRSTGCSGHVLDNLWLLLWSAVARIRGLGMCWARHHATRGYFLRMSELCESPIFVESIVPRY